MIGLSGYSGEAHHLASTPTRAPVRLWLRRYALLVISLLPPAVGAEGLLVLEAAPGFAAADAGLAAGDRLLRWQRSDDDHVHPLATPLDLALVEFNVAASSAIITTIERNGDHRKLTVEREDWRLRIAPALPATDLAALADAYSARADGDGSRSYAVLAETLADALPEERFADTLWLLYESGREQVRAGDRTAAAQLVRRAYRLGARMDDDQRALIAMLLAPVLRDAGEHDEAAGWLADGLALAPSSAPALRARLQLQAAATLAARAGHRQARALYDQAIEELDASLPASLVMVELLFRRANAASFLGQPLDGAADLERARRILADRGERGRLYAEVENAIGVSRFLAGDINGAEIAWQHALDGFRSHGNDDYNVSKVLNALGLVATQRGALRQAESHLDEALRLAQRSDPGTLLELNAVANRAYVYSLREEHDAAIADQRRVLELRQRLAPDSIPLAQDLHNLGTRLERAGRSEQAAGYFIEALTLKRRIASDSASPATTLQALGRQAFERGDLDQASRYFSEGLAIISRHVPGGLDEAALLFDSAEVALMQGQLELADDAARRSLRLRAELAPESWVRAESEHLSGRIARRQGNDDGARQHFRAAIAALTAQIELLGGTELSRSRFRARFQRLFKDLIELEVDNDRIDAAFAASEQYRSGELARLIGNETVPDPDYARLRDEFAAAARAYDRTLAQMTKAEGAARDDLHGRLEALAAGREALRGKLRSTRFGQALHTESSSPQEIAARLPAGTAVLSYIVLPEASLLFVIARSAAGETSFGHYRLAIGAAELSAHVARLRLMLRVPDAPVAVQRQWRRLADELGQMLIAPAAKQLEDIQDLAVAGDGALHLLPFAVLATDAGCASGSCHLIERFSLRRIAAADTATRVATIGSVASQVLTFADPDLHHLRGDTAPDTASQRLFRALPHWPLPGARNEARAVAGVFAPRARMYLGTEAGEGRLKREAAQAQVLHFATHAVLDESRPLDSYLVLSADEGENGLLQGWEVIEQLRLHDALVALSGCDTALGADAGGEGLLGLTRAFELAGARDVLATLWAIDDDGSAALIPDALGRWHAGETLPRALAQAQRARLAADSTGWLARLAAGLGLGSAIDPTHPFYWAGFSLYSRSP